MNIKKLSIVGFKSFMDRLDIIFPKGISGVVGPNGCGKSNIVDAIRWCMGEQSPKQLRGRQMEDIIFSGAGDFRALGMAEVSLVFENGDGSFPQAYSHETELSVTRRLYRSGDSEYLINNVPCRLKDIFEIFMDTGLGNKAYSIIGQGRIGAILEQKPEETRVMLEEAAGITKYRKKVEASQKKIELTEGNLQRVEDIIGEVERQIRSLKRQAAKARRYKSLSEEIRNLELTLHADSYRQLKEESGSRLKSTEDLGQQEMAMSTAFSQLQAGIENMGLELEEKDQRLSELRKNFLLLREKVHKKEAGLQALAGEMKMQEEMEGRLAGEREEIKARLIGLQDEQEEAGRKIEETEEKALALEEEIALGEKRLRTKREFMVEIKEVYEKAKAGAGKNAHTEVGLTHESGYLSKMINQITDSRSRLEKELAEAEEKMEAVLAASDKKGLAREATSGRLKQIEEQASEVRLESEELEHIKQRVESDLKTAEAALNVSQSRLSSLQSLSENFEGYKIGVRTIMKATDLEPRREGRVLGLVADAIRVDVEYEQAVEAVLADRLQHIIVESQEDGLQGIDYLKSKAKGKSSFIPLNDLNPVGAGNGKPHPFPLLRDLITVPERYRPLMQAMLGETMLVEDLQQAVTEWRKNGRDRCFVTLDGDMVDQRGVISGGASALHSRGLLGRRREIEELKAQTATEKRQVEDLRIRLENVILDIDEKKQSLQGLTDEKWTCQDEINELDKIIFRLGQELDQLEKLSRRIKEDLQSKEKEHTQHREHLSRIEEQLRECRERREKEEEFLRIKEAELKASEDEFEQFREALAKLKGDHRIVQEERRSLIRERDRLEEFAEESKGRLEKIEEDISQGRSRHEERKRRMEVLQEELQGRYATLKEEEEAVNGADRDRQTFHSRMKEEEAKAGRMRSEIESLREKINAAKMEQSEIRFKMNSLSETVKDRFDIDLPSSYEQFLEMDFSVAEAQEKLQDRKRLRQQLGEVNLTAIKELEALEERQEFIHKQREDLLSSIESLKKAIQKINKTSLEKFKETFQEVDKKLREVFPILFNGGEAALKMTDESRPLESGILVEVRPPGKRISHMGLLSGGEKALVAMALLFAIYMIKPSPFCLLDEVDAPLDEANIDRYNDLLKEIKKSSQIIMVTHNRRSMEIADRLFGVTMEKAGVSKLVSVDIQRMVEGAAMDPHAN